MARKKVSASISEKIVPPRLPKIIRRDRLLSELDHARKRSIVWITAPAGSGKTTLIADYLQSRKLQAVWYKIDEGDADPATFFQFLKNATSFAARGRNTSIPSFTQEHLLSIPIFTRQFFDALYARCQQPSILVVDNFQLLPHDASTQDILVTAAEMLPSHINIVIASHLDPPPLFSRLLANQAISMINAGALLLTQRETAELCLLRKKQAGTSEQFYARFIFTKTQGWLAGTILFLESEHGEDDLASVPESIFAYLAEEIFNRFPPSMQKILLTTAWCPIITGDMAKSLTGIHQSVAHLRTLHRGRYFVERLQGTPERYRYHQLFQDFLKNLAATRFSRPKVRSLQRQTAQLLEDSGQVEDAFALWQDLQAYPALIRLLLAHAPNFINQGRVDVLQQWIEAIPSAYQQKEPWLTYWLGVCRFHSSPPEAKQLFVAAFKQFRPRKGWKGKLTAYCSILEVIVHTWDDLSELDEWLALAPKLCSPQRFQALSPQLRASVASTFFQAFLWRQPDATVIDKWLEESKIGLPALPHDFQRGLLLFNLTSFLCIRGKSDHALTFLNSLFAPRRTDDLSVFQVWLYFCLAHVSFYRADFQSHWKAIEVMENALNRPDIWIPQGGAYLAQKCYYGLGTNKIAFAHKALEEMGETIERLPRLAQAHGMFMMGWLAVLEGQSARAVSVLRKGLKLASLTGGPFPEATCCLALADVLVEGRQWRGCSKYAERGLAIAKRMKSPMLIFQGLLVKARLAKRSKNEKVFCYMLMKAMATGRAYHIWNYPYWRSDVLGNLCEEALQRNIEVPYVQQLIRHRQLQPTKSPLTIPHWPWPIKISALGRFAIIIDGQVFQHKRKAPRKPLQLLKVLLALGGTDISESTIMDFLWPDADGDFAYQNFNTTLHRLRSILRHQDAVFLQDKLVSLNPQLCWVDIWAWDRLFEDKPRSGSKSKNQEEPLGWVAQALRLYQGPFLSEEPDEPWVDWLRTRLRSQYLKLLETEVIRLHNQGQLEAGYELLEKACRAEPQAVPMRERLLRRKEKAIVSKTS